MTENEKTLKALSQIAAELHIQNWINISVANKRIPKYSTVSEELIPKLAEHLNNYFEGGSFSPGLVTQKYF